MTRKRVNQSFRKKQPKRKALSSKAIFPLVPEERQEAIPTATRKKSGDSVPRYHPKNLAIIWRAGLVTVAIGILTNIFTTLIGQPEPLQRFVEQHPIIALVVGVMFVTITIASFIIAIQPEWQHERLTPHPHIAQRLSAWFRVTMVPTILPIISFTLLSCWVLLVFLRPSWCSPAICPASHVLTYGFHDENLDVYFTTFQSATYVLPGDLARYSLQNLPDAKHPESIGTQMIDGHILPPPYRIVLGVQDLQEGRYGLILEQVALVVDDVLPIPKPLHVWVKGTPFNYGQNLYRVLYRGQRAGAVLAATYLPAPISPPQLNPREADELSIEIASSVPVNLQFHLRITYRMTNDESQARSIDLPSQYFDMIFFSSSSARQLYKLRDGHLVPGS